MLNWRCSNIYSIKNNAREEVIEKKSRFIGSAYQIKDKKEAEEIIANVKKEFWDARHNVYAYILPDNICKYSDDGEPQGTAGLPVFNVLAKKNLQNVLVIVTRYFGGILLGKGGLVRAYTEATVKAVESAGIYEVIEYTDIEIICEYNIKDKLLFFLDKSGYDYISEYYEKVKCRIHLPSADLSSFVDEVIKFTENRIFYNIVSNN